MATKEKDTNKELEVEEIVSRSEQFIENNSKKIIYGIIALALVVGAVLGIKPKNFGVIVRTVAEGKRVAELDGELKVLLKHWEDAIKKYRRPPNFRH